MSRILITSDLMIKHIGYSRIEDARYIYYDFWTLWLELYKNPNMLALNIYSYVIVWKYSTACKILKTGPLTTSTRAYMELGRVLKIGTLGRVATPFPLPPTKPNLVAYLNAHGGAWVQSTWDIERENDLATEVFGPPVIPEPIRFKDEYSLKARILTKKAVLPAFMKTSQV